MSRLKKSIFFTFLILALLLIIQYFLGSSIDYVFTAEITVLAFIFGFVFSRKSHYS
jgi:hypothetical protein